MRKFRLNKLVRDGIPRDMGETGQGPKVRTLSRQEFLKALRDKFYEELGEFDPKAPNAAKELADLLEIVEAFCHELDIEFADLRKLQKKRRNERGGFGKRQFVETVSMEDDNKWAQYYGSEPERFPEISDQ